MPFEWKRVVRRRRSRSRRRRRTRTRRRKVCMCGTRLSENKERGKEGKEERKKRGITIDAILLLVFGSTTHNFKAFRAHRVCATITLIYHLETR